jgi:hypothetical protein
VLAAALQEVDFLTVFFVDTKGIFDASSRIKGVCL